MRTHGKRAARRLLLPWRRAVLAMWGLVSAIVLACTMGTAEGAARAAAAGDLANDLLRVPLPSTGELTTRRLLSYEISSPCRERERTETRAREIARDAEGFCVAERTSPPAAIIQIGPIAPWPDVRARVVRSARAPPAFSTS